MINNRVFIQFDDAFHSYTTLSELSSALSGMSVTEMKQC